MRAAQAQRPAAGCCGQTCWLRAPCLRPCLSGQTQDACFPVSRNTAALLAPGLAPRVGGGAPHRPALVPTSSWPAGLNHLDPTGPLCAEQPGALDGWGWGRGAGGHSHPCASGQGAGGGPAPAPWLTRAGAVLFIRWGSTPLGCEESLLHPSSYCSGAPGLPSKKQPSFTCDSWASHSPLWGHRLCRTPTSCRSGSRRLCPHRAHSGRPTQWWTKGSCPRLWVLASRGEGREEPGRPLGKGGHGGGLGIPASPAQSLSWTWSGSQPWGAEKGEE